MAEANFPLEAMEEEHESSEADANLPELVSVHDVENGSDAEVHYDSDATELLSNVESDVEDVISDAGEQEDGEGNQSPSILEDVESPVLGRRQPLLEDIFSEDEIEEIPVVPYPEAAGAAAANVPPQPRAELQHSFSPSPEPIDDPQPLPTPPVSIESSHIPEQPMPLPSSEQSQAGTSQSPLEGIGSSVVAGVSNQAEVPSAQAVAGPSAPEAPSSKAPERKPKDAAPATAMEEEDSDAVMCPICLDPCTNLGEHRIASLKCGHLFGVECLKKWLPSREKGRCPQCNDQAARKDIRVIYGKSIKVLDTTEKERIQKELEKEREEKRKLQVEHAQIKLKYKMKEKLVVNMQKELEALKAAVKRGEHPHVSSSKAGVSGNSKKRLTHVGSLEVCREGSCRVMAHNEWLGMLVVSMPSQVGMFPGFGIKKINLLELRMGQYVPLHRQQIRDLAFSPIKQDLLLSVSMDRAVRVTNIHSNASVALFSAPQPIWCCCWSATEWNVFYVGTSSGHIYKYNTCSTSNPVASVELPGSGPIVSMAYIQPSAESSLTLGGLVVARLQACFFVDVEMPGEVMLQSLLQGTFTSVSSGANTSHVLVSCRPSAKNPHVRHILCLLQQVNNPAQEGEESGRTVTVQPIHTFEGGTSQKIMTRSLLACLPDLDSSPLVYASDESTQSIYVWDVSTMTCLQQLRHSETVMDLLQVSREQIPHLVALGEKGVKLYRWDKQ